MRGLILLTLGYQKSQWQYQPRNGSAGGSYTVKQSSNKAEHLQKQQVVDSGALSRFLWKLPDCLHLGRRLFHRHNSQSCAARPRYSPTDTFFRVLLREGSRPLSLRVRRFPHGPSVKLSPMQELSLWHIEACKKKELSLPVTSLRVSHKQPQLLQRAHTW